jgi:O-acetylserine/cysteine efflux transporter
MNQLAFVVWASLVPPLPLLALSGVLEGPAVMATALQAFSWQSFAAVAYIAWASTLFGYAVWNFLLAHYPVNRIAPFTLLVPLVGLSTGWLVFGESLQPVHFAGGALLMVGLLVNLFGGALLARWQSKT